MKQKYKVRHVRLTDLQEEFIQLELEKRYGLSFQKYALFKLFPTGWENYLNRVKKAPKDNG